MSWLILEKPFPLPPSTSHSQIYNQLLGTIVQDYTNPTNRRPSRISEQSPLYIHSPVGHLLEYNYTSISGGTEVPTGAVLGAAFSGLPVALDGGLLGPDSNNGQVFKGVQQERCVVAIEVATVYSQGPCRVKKDDVVNEPEWVLGDIGESLNGLMDHSEEVASDDDDDDDDDDYSDLSEEESRSEVEYNRSSSEDSSDESGDCQSDAAEIERWQSIKSQFASSEVVIEEVCLENV
ncbi:hypothetical protein QBC38DRAFT_447407 [Podospora fimiseda]|uniref:Uncharacterized protein n=1 Tax=Podospora fimiseda TaxID=252190 RepID=A0AAN7GUI6_9PEZI|nr:hypothetical protein QBC38DRAFT_447407 [Podospora fimiseda]